MEINYGLGFSSQLLTQDEYYYILENRAPLSEGEVKLEFIHFPDMSSTKENGVIVMKKCGNFPCSGKLATFEDIKNLVSQEMIIKVETKEAILKELQHYKLEHLLDKIDVVFYLNHTPQIQTTLSTR